MQRWWKFCSIFVPVKPPFPKQKILPFSGAGLSIDCIVTKPYNPVTILWSLTLFVTGKHTVTENKCHGWCSGIGNIAKSQKHQCHSGSMQVLPVMTQHELNRPAVCLKQTGRTQNCSENKDVQGCSCSGCHPNICLQLEGFCFSISWSEITLHYKVFFTMLKGKLCFGCGSPLAVRWQLQTVHLPAESICCQMGAVSKISACVVVN